MSYLLDAMQHLGIYYTPARILALGTGDGKSQTYEQVAANPPFTGSESVMRKLPDCPVCSEHELRLSRAGDKFWIHCYECGWKSGIVTMREPTGRGQEVDAAIAEVVSRAKPIAPD